MQYIIFAKISICFLAYAIPYLALLFPVLLNSPGRKIRNHLSHFKTNNSDLESGDANEDANVEQSSNHARFPLGFRLDYVQQIKIFRNCATENL